MCSSPDFEDVKAVLNDRTDRSIELFRNCFTIHLSNGSHFFTLGALCFLVIAENIHFGYGRLSPAELKEQAERIGYVTFSLLLAIPDIGFIVVRIAGLIMLSGYPAVATSLVLLTMSPTSIIPILAYLARLPRQDQRGPDEEVDTESGTVGSDAS